MTGHDRADARINRGAERAQLDRVDACATVLHHRRIEVRIGAGVAVAGEVLGAGQHAFALQSLN
jgi:hypothetical protein